MKFRRREEEEKLVHQNKAMPGFIEGDGEKWRETVEGENGGKRWREEYGGEKNTGKRWREEEARGKKYLEINSSAV